MHSHAGLSQRVIPCFLGQDTWRLTIVKDSTFACWNFKYLIPGSKFNFCICFFFSSAVCFSFLLFLWQGHLFSVVRGCPSPTSSYFTWCDSEVWVVVTTEDTGPSLFYLRSFCCCKQSLLHICCWDREEPCTTIPHPHLVRNMPASISSQKYERDNNLFLLSIKKGLDLHDCTIWHI